MFFNYQCEKVATPGLIHSLKGPGINCYYHIRGFFFWSTLHVQFNKLKTLPERASKPKIGNRWHDGGDPSCFLCCWSILMEAKFIITKWPVISNKAMRFMLALNMSLSSLSFWVVFLNSCGSRNHEALCRHGLHFEHMILNLCALRSTSHFLRQLNGKAILSHFFSSSNFLTGPTGEDGKWGHC